MRFLPFLAILIVGAGTLLLGVDLMTLPQKPAAQLTGAPPKPLVSAPNKLAQHEADLRAENTEGDSGRPLTPLYPASPGSAKDVRVVYPPNNQPTDQPSDQTAAATETTGAAPAGEQKAAVAATADSNAPTPQPQQTHTEAPQPAQKPQPVKVEEPFAQKPAQGAVEHVSDHCDVQACASAYASFRASDCTYQPFEGARRVCTAPPSQRSVQSARPHEFATRPERIASPRPREAGPRTSQSIEALDDGDADIDAPPARGRRLIVIERPDDNNGYEDQGYRPWR